MLWFVLSIIVVATSSIGKAIADRLAGRTTAPTDADDIRWLEHRIEERIAGLEDRVEYAERQLGQDDSSRHGLGRPPAGTG